MIIISLELTRVNPDGGLVHYYHRILKLEQAVQYNYRLYVKANRDMPFLWNLCDCP